MRELGRRRTMPQAVKRWKCLLRAPQDSMGTPGSYYTRAARDGHSYFLKQTPSHLAIYGIEFKKKYKKISHQICMPSRLITSPITPPLSDEWTPQT